MKRETKDETLKRAVVDGITRRFFMKECAVPLGAIAMNAMFGGDLLRAETKGPPNPLAPKAPHYAPKIKRIIYLFQGGAPSHLELFDNKPELAK